MPCKPILPDHMVNLTSTLYDLTSGLNSSDNFTNDIWNQEWTMLDSIEHALKTKVNLAICIFGLIGNIMNLIVMTQRGLSGGLSRMERSATSGLVALAISDMLFCISVIPNTFVGTVAFGSYKNPYDFRLFYRLYSNAVINTFIMTSTWLTVTMALSRFVAICHPLRARQVIGTTFASSVIGLVFTLCTIFNLPRFFVDRSLSIDCEDGTKEYFAANGLLTEYPRLETVYMYVYFACAVLIPLLLLTFCNVNLISTLRQSSRLRRRYNQRHDRSNDDSTERITLTLVVIIIMYIILVTPAELNNFARDIVVEKRIHVVSSLVTFFNTMQSANFAFNFVLYCVVNTHFRQGVYVIICWTTDSREAKYDIRYIMDQVY